MKFVEAAHLYFNSKKICLRCKISNNTQNKLCRKCKYSHFRKKKKVVTYKK